MKKSNLLLAVAGAVMSTSANALVLSADIVTIVDESGSMSGEHSWLGGAMTGLNSQLIAAGVGVGSYTNRFGLTGYGASNSAPHMHLVDGTDMGSVNGYVNAASGLETTGSTEDGYAGMAYAFANYQFNPNSALNMVLVTDEDRDVLSAYTATTYQTLLQSFLSMNALLNAVVNVNFVCGSGAVALGMDSLGNGYVADGAGSYSTCTGAHATTGSGTSIANYVQLALDTGGAAWNLNLLRQGGLTAQSFTDAFIDIKVNEIVQQPPVAPVPVPAAVWLFGAGLVGMFGFVRKAVA